VLALDPGRGLLVIVLRAVGPAQQDELELLEFDAGLLS
jgi:hypothetical protein